MDKMNQMVREKGAGRRAKIVSTLGPSSDTVEIIKELILAGLDVARINMSHGTYDKHRLVIKNIREASRELKKEVAILLDLQGPKIRVDKLSSPMELKNGEEYVIGPSSIQNKYPQYKECYIPTVYENLVKDASEKATILFDDGLIEAQGMAKEGDLLKIKIINGGMLKSNKGINLPDSNVSAPSFTQKDKDDLLFGLAEEIDYIALSFVRTKNDILEVKKLLHSLKRDTPIVAKIERPEAIININEIIEVSDVIMIARGDMGVELGNHLVPSVQKKIISLCNDSGVPVITATQMLESMISNPRPTRAEASDVANAIWDGTDAVMLSAETASGDHPVKSIEMMGKIIYEAEKIPKSRPYIRNISLKGLTDALQISASLISEKLKARWIISFTETGKSSVRLSRFRPRVKILGVTHSLKAARRMVLYWGVTPYCVDIGKSNTSVDWEEKIIQEFKEVEDFQNGDKIVITYGDGKVFDHAHANSVRVELVKDRPKVLGGSDGIEVVETKKGDIKLDTLICASCQSCIQTCPHGIFESSPFPANTTYINKEMAEFCMQDMKCVESCPTGAIEILVKNE